MIYRNVRQNLWVLRIERNTNILGRPATGTSNFPADRCGSRLKDTPIRAIGARPKIYEIRVGSEQGLLYCSYGTHGAVKNSMAELHHGA